MFFTPAQLLLFYCRTNFYCLWSKPRVPRFLITLSFVHDSLRQQSNYSSKFKRNFSCTFYSSLNIFSTPNSLLSGWIRWSILLRHVGRKSLIRYYLWRYKRISEVHESFAEPRKHFFCYLVTDYFLFDFDFKVVFLFFLSPKFSCFSSRRFPACFSISNICLSCNLKILKLSCEWLLCGFFLLTNYPFDIDHFAHDMLSDSYHTSLYNPIPANEDQIDYTSHSRC